MIYPSNIVIIYVNDHYPQHACPLPDAVLHQIERLPQYMHKKISASLQAAWSGKKTMVAQVYQSLCPFLG